MHWFSATIFLSAYLLFLVQPLIARYILPWFGGSPSVWTTCMLFFQVVLLVGYGYAYFVNRYLTHRAQVFLHLGLLASAVFFLPIIPHESWKPIGGESPEWLILGLLLSTIGVPYFLLSTTGPLLQSWFSAKYPGRSPYRLYALSNIGSLLALIAYPFFFETILGTRPQAIYWSFGFGGFVLLVVISGLTTLKALSVTQENGIENTATTIESDRLPKEGLASAKGGWLSWLILSTLPSILLLAVTNELCQESATIPFLWILPLSIYLLSFIICFDAPRWYHREFYFVATIVLTAIVIFQFRTPTMWNVLILPAYLFCAAMLCHGELARQKPIAKKLTLFYLMLSIGGALGGVFVVLIAPLIFSRFFELHVAMTGVLLAGLGNFWRDSPRALDRVFYLLAILGFLSALYAAMYFSIGFTGNRWAQTSIVISWVVVGIATASWMSKRSEEYRLLADKSVKKHSGLKKSLAIFSFSLWALIAIALIVVLLFLRAENFSFTLIPMQLALALLAVSILVATDFAWPVVFIKWNFLGQILLLTIAIGFFFMDVFYGVNRGTIEIRRGFYGPASVVADDSLIGDKNGVGRVLMLFSGRIQHGFQYLGEKAKRTKTTYYGRASGVAKMFAALPKRLKKEPIEMGVVGLGIGTIATWGETGDRITFFEINPIIIDMTRKYFTCLQDSFAETHVRLGDGRLLLEQELTKPDFRPYDVLVIDAFTGDTIPRHLLTKECFELYSRAMADDGVMLVNVTHHYFDLKRVVFPLAQSIGREANMIVGEPKDDASDFFETKSQWIIVTRNKELLENKAFQESITIRDGGEPVVWTDDFGSMAQILKFGR